MAIEQADNVQTGAPKPTDSRYYNNLLPWVDEAAAKAGIGSGVRYSGLTVNIAGTEWWWKDGITDPDLVVKESGGGTLNMSGSTVDGLTTYVDATTICAQPGLTLTNSGQDLKLSGDTNDDIEIKVNNLNSTGNAARATVIANAESGGQLGMFTYGSGNTASVFGEAMSGSSLLWSNQCKLLIGVQAVDAPVKIYHGNGLERIATATDGVQIKELAACTFASLPAYINTDGTISTGSTLSDIYHTLGKLSPATFPYVDGTYTVSAETVINASDTDYTIRIIPDDSSYTVHYGYTTADGYRNRTQSTNLTFLLTTQDTADRFGTYYMYLPKDGVGTASETEYGNEPTPVPDGRFLLASMRFRNSGNAAGEIIEITNYSRTELGVSGGTSGGGGITMDGTTVNGLTTYVDADTICAHQYLQWDGNNLNLSGDTTEAKSIQIGVGRSGSGYAYIDFVGDTTYTDYGFRLIRANGGENTNSVICHRGTGNLDIATPDGGAINLCHAGTTKMCTTSTRTCFPDGIDVSDTTTTVAIFRGVAGGTGTQHTVQATNKGTGSGQYYAGYFDGYSATAEAEGRSTGVLGLAGNRSGGYNYGVVGLICGTCNGVGVIGSTGSLPYPTVAGIWAGYFCGPVYMSTTACAITCVSSPVVCATTCVGVGGNIRFNQGADRCILVDTATDGGAGDSLNLYGGCGDSDASPGTGGNLRLAGGTGGQSTSSVDGAVGGYGILCGGIGGAGNPTADGGQGGRAIVRGGAGGSGDSNGNGGCVEICSGNGVVDGCVMLYHDTTKRLHTTTTGMYTTGVHCSSTCSRSNYHYSVVCACSPVHCATTAFRAASAGYKFCSTSGCGCAVDWVATSDCRMKKCIEPIISALSKVDALCGVCYEFCGDGTLDMGLIAQDVEKVEPRLVSKGEADEYHKEKYGIEDETLGLKYDKFAGLFVEAIKELKEQNICLQNQINELRKIK